MRRWKIKPLDTLFFRSGQPFNAGESTYIESLFPPSPETVQGLVRTAILYHYASDFEGYTGGRNGAASIPGIDLFSEIGDPTQGGVGRLRLQGPFPVKDGQLLFPAPLDVAKTHTKLVFLRPGDPMRCDLGKVPLPIAVGVGLKMLERIWVTAAVMGKLLSEDLPGEHDLIDEEVPEGFLRKNVQAARQREGATLYVTEPRVGIARDNSTRTVREGYLYAIAPFRLRDGVELIAGVGGIDERLHPSTTQVVRFGGEGKLVEITCDEAWKLPECPSQILEPADRTRFRIVLATPVRFGAWHPPGFKQTERNGKTCWTGSVNSLQCEIVSACVGKSIKLGGWDLVKSGSKDLEACVPAGSVYFCETREGWENVRKLHGQNIGTGAEIGFGLMLIGRWT